MKNPFGHTYKDNFSILAPHSLYWFCSSCNSILEHSHQHSYNRSLYRWSLIISMCLTCRNKSKSMAESIVTRLDMYLHFHSILLVTRVNMKVWVFFSQWSESGACRLGSSRHYTKCSCFMYQYITVDRNKCLILNSMSTMQTHINNIGEKNLKVLLYSLFCCEHVSYYFAWKRLLCHYAVFYAFIINEDNWST